jgi:alpha-1,2-mannosyltransferase
VTLIVWTGYALYSNLTDRFSLDLRIYRAAGAAFFAGKDVYALHFTSYRLSFTYPPFALLVLSPLSWVPVHLVEALWWVADCACLVYIVHFCVTTVARSRFPHPWRLALLLTPCLALALEPLRRNTTYGQINVLLFLLVIVDLTSVRARGRGGLVGIAAAIKLTPMIFIIVFILRRDWRAVAQCIGAFLVASLLGFAVLPSGSRLFWEHRIFEPGRTGGVVSAVNQSIYAVVRRWPFAFDHGTAQSLWLILVAATLLVGIWLASRLLSRDDLGGAILALGLTSESISPVSWSHHWVWVVLLPFMLVRTMRTQPVVSALMVVLLGVAALGPYSWDLTGLAGHLTADSLIGVGFVLLYVWGATELLQERSWRFVPDRAADASVDRGLVDSQGLHNPIMGTEGTSLRLE